MLSNVLSRSDLLEAPAMKNGDPVSQGKRFEDVVGHEDDCLLQPLFDGEKFLLEPISCQ